MLSANAAHLTPDQACSVCGAQAVLGHLNQIVPYGNGSEYIELSVEVPVWSCTECDTAYTGAEAEDLRHAAVCRHLRRLAPGEIRKIRYTLGLSQDEFAKLLGFGPASIKRWESGNQIQSDSADRFIRLLRQSGVPGALKGIVAKLDNSLSSAKQFRTRISDDQRKAAENFRLSSCSLLAAA